jgi:FixJ family two-component response regulator
VSRGIDDDLSARTAIRRLVGAMCFGVRAFGSGLEFLYGELPVEPRRLTNAAAPGLQYVVAVREKRWPQR